jgi:hypothetical protein
LNNHKVQINDKEDSRTKKANGRQSGNHTSISGCLNIKANWKPVSPEQLPEINGKRTHEPQIYGNTNQGTHRLNMYFIPVTQSASRKKFPYWNKSIKQH